MSLKSLASTGTKVWSDSVDPEVLDQLIPQGVTGATSNPIIISDLIKSGRFDEHLESLLEDMNDTAVAWEMTSYLVGEAQEKFQRVWAGTGGDDGWVSFELDPLVEDPETNLPHAQRIRRYVTLGKHWSSGHTNRMIKVPATPAGLESLEALAAEGISLNVTLIFTQRQYEQAREAVWRGAQRRRHGLEGFKSVYSVFVSRVDAYADKSLPDLPEEAKRLLGLVNAKRMWQSNEAFWRDKKLPLRQEMIFASTGAKLKWQAPDYYVRALAGSDIQTNPPETNEAIATAGGPPFERTVDRLPDKAVLEAIDGVDVRKLEDVLMAEGIGKFAKPQRALLDAVKQKRAALDKR